MDQGMFKLISVLNSIDEMDAQELRQVETRIAIRRQTLNPAERGRLDNVVKLREAPPGE